MNLKDVFTSKWIALPGIFGPIIALAAIAISILLSPWFSFQDNALSDLGVHDVAPIFNFGLIVCGILCAFYCIGLFFFIGTNWPRKVGVLTLLFATIALIGIGVFTEDYSPHHFYFSAAFFVLLLLACLILGLSMLRDPELKKEGLIALSVAVIGVVGWIIPRGDGVAIPELLSVVPAAILFLALSSRTYRVASKVNALK